MKGNLNMSIKAILKRPASWTRRQKLQRVAAVAVTAIVGAACGTTNSVAKGQQVRPADLIYAFNKGDGTVSVIDPSTATVKVVQNLPFPAYGLYPSNQYGLGSGYLLVPEPGKVVILKDQNLKAAATINMAAAKGIWAAIMPNGKTGLLVGRSTDQISWVNMDPASREFGVVTRSVTVPNQAGLCDVSLSPSGKYAYIPDLLTNQIQVVDTTTGNTVYQASVPGLVKPFMGTVSWNGKIWAVESSDGNGSVFYFDLTNPAKPKLIKSVTQLDGLGLGAHTDEFSANGRYDFVLDRTSSQVSVVDTSTFNVVHTITLPAGGLPRVGAFSYNGNKLFVSLEGVNSVADINTKTFALTSVIKVGTDPVGIAPTDYSWVHNG